MAKKKGKRNNENTVKGKKLKTASKQQNRVKTGKKEKKEKKKTPKKSKKPDIKNVELTPEEIKKGYYWSDLRKQSNFLLMNHRMSRPHQFSYFTAVPVSVYMIPIGGEEEEDPKAKKKTKRKKK